MMGIYYVAIDGDEIIEPPENFGNTFPCVFHPHSPFPNMVMMMNCLGNHFEIYKDSDWEFVYRERKNITKEVFEKYLEFFPEYRKFYNKE